jgi:enoyl-CoA hydratase/carnithine racemase
MSLETIVVERRGTVGWITLNRPAALNALSALMLEELGQALQQLADDDGARVVVITGTGRAFCAGADLKASKARLDSAPAADPRDQPAVRFVRMAQRLFRRIESLPKPTIAAVNGTAVAGGLELLLACDLVIAAEDAKIGDAHANYGLLPGGGGSVRLARKIGLAQATFLMLTGDLLPARELVACGLINRVVPANAVASGAAELAERLAAKSPLVMQRMKQLINDGVEQPKAVALRNELLMYALHADSYDRREGLSAFAEKRSPVFQGR